MPSSPSLQIVGGKSPSSLPDLPRAFAALGVDLSTPESLHRTLPFAGSDATAGAENELQAVVLGRRDSVDLPLTVEKSTYFANLVRRARSGEVPGRLVSDLESFLQAQREEAWENSWVRIPRRLLTGLAERVFETDLRADKGDPASGRRGDAGAFFLREEGREERIRVPVSYLVKLALADAVDAEALPEPVRETGVRLMAHYLSDNTSPETFSFHVVPMRRESGMGKSLARETAKRFLLTQLLTLYANERFALTESGQEARIYFAPQTPVRQRELNDLISDAFYRELFMSPCLSGWDRGEAKHRYMHLCHQVLSRSQLNAVAKLREAGIITNNLVVLPSLSNTSLANNGTHVSLGSRLLTRSLREGTPGFGREEEKCAGDLAIKIQEHFLPLFAGSYSAAPCRLDFTDFHPEKALGFLPHQLDYTHLRMLWRRWKKKASLSFFGHAATPFGPPWLDRGLSRLFGWRGDFVPDFRLIDYPVCLLSTEESPALDGRTGNHDKLRRDLGEMGGFDPQMSLYLFFRQREFATMKFSGFEGRHYSLFPDLQSDLGHAASLQQLVTAFAFRLMAGAKVGHRDIPDTPAVESERRQIFFGTAIGVPTFFVRRDTENRFLRGILARTEGTRPSRRYPGYLRVRNDEYRRALLEILETEAADLVEGLGVRRTLDDLRRRLQRPEEFSATGRLTRSILSDLKRSSPLHCEAREFNLAAESHYRTALRRSQMEEGIDLIEDDLKKLTRGSSADASLRPALDRLVPGESAAAIFASVRHDLLAGRLSAPVLRRLIALVLLCLRRDMDAAEELLKEKDDERLHSPVHRAG